MDNFDAKVWSAFDCIAEQDDYGDWFTFTIDNYEITGEDENNIYLNVYGFAFDDDPITLECRYNKTKGVFII
jgi:hypothetical protein